MAENKIQNATVLAILPAREDRLSLSVAFAGSGWMLVFTGSLGEGLAVLQSILVGAVLCDIHLPGGHTWRDLISEMRKMGDPPPLIVTDRLADDRLWIEALNLGVYDLLAKPFGSGEALRTITTACRRHENRPRLVPSRKRPEAHPDAKEAAQAMGACL